MPDSSAESRLLSQSFEQTLAGKKRFEEIDNEVMAATAEIVKAAAQLAAAKPEEFFGLRASERDRYFVEQLLLPAIRAEAGATPPDGDIVGGAGLLDTLKGVLGGLIPGAEIAEKLIDLIKSEKDYWLKGEQQSGTRVRTPG